MQQQGILVKVRARDKITARAKARRDNATFKASALLAVIIIFITTAKTIAEAM